jgi:Domain of unknown function (DUF5103)
MLKLFFLIIALCVHSWLSAQAVANPHSFNPNIYSAQVYPTGNPLGEAFYELGTTSGLTFEFDEIDTDAYDYKYAVFLCDYDWQLSSLSTNDYLQGFPQQEITDIQHSFNTLVEYTHYRFSFPNDMMKLRLSGNYFVVVYLGDEPMDETQWQCTFRIIAYESLVQVTGKVQASNVIAERFKNQEIDFTLQHADYSIYDYHNGLHCAIYQNMNWRTCISDLAPVFINGNELVYDFNLGENDFPGGAEYRNFEFKSMQYQSAAVEDMQRQEDGYHLFLRKDLPTGNRAQSSGVDINGHFFIRNDLGNESSIESEYVWIHFSLAMPFIQETEVLLEGHYFNMLTTPVVLKYNEVSRMYEAKVLMKQGLYDYRYLTTDAYSTLPVTNTTEGNSAGTENTYFVIVYNSDRQTGQDRVIAIKAMSSTR